MLYCWNIYNNMKQSLLRSAIRRLSLLGHLQCLFLYSFHLNLILIMIQLYDLFEIAKRLNRIDSILWIDFLALLNKEGELPKSHIIFDPIK